MRTTSAAAFCASSSAWRAAFSAAFFAFSASFARFLSSLLEGPFASAPSSVLSTYSVVFALEGTVTHGCSWGAFWTGSVSAMIVASRYARFD